MVGEHWELLYPEEDVQAIYEDVIPKVEGTGYWQGRTTGKRADGSTFIEDHRLALTEHGELVCTVRDISDKTDRDRKLDRMDAMLSTLFETLPVGVLAEDESRNVLASNDRLMDLFDVDGSPTDLVGENCDRLATTVCHLFADPDAFVDRIDELVARREPVRGEELRLNDGRTFSRSYEPVSFSDGKGHLWVYRDVTEQKERERQLEERTDQLESLTVRLEEQYRYLFEEAPVMAVVTRAEAGEPIIEDCNHLFAETLGYDKEDLIDRKLARYYTDESRRSLLDEGDYERALSGRLMREERVLVSGSGEHVDTLLRAVPRYDLTDNVVGTLAFFVDVTERRELEQERDRLEDFSDIVSHDLRNPLNVAQGSLEAARHECTCDSGNEHLAAIEEAHDRIQTLIEELLLLARSGDHVDEPEPIDVQSLVRSCWQTVETADATAVVEIDRRVMADRGRLRQLFENLVRNAVEHGGDDVTVTVGTLDDGFFVEDDGAGIPPEYHERVFEAGFSGAESGTGIGLSIVDEIAQAHDWSVHVTDGTYGGARFELRGVTFERS